MFFSFQTPTSEYAQALVDFHHYVFFFLIVVVIFVIWMIKLALLFVMREKKLLFVLEKEGSDFYFEEENAWFGPEGELYYLLGRLKDVVVSFFFTYNNKLDLPFNEQFFYEAAICFFVYEVQNLFYLIWGYNQFFFKILWLLDREFSLFPYMAIWRVSDNDIDETSFKFFAPFFRSYWELKTLRVLASELANRFNNSVGYESEAELAFTSNRFFNLLPLNTSKHFEEKSLFVTIFSLPSVLLSRVKFGLNSTRLSHWIWGSKAKDKFLCFTGEGEHYDFDPADNFSFGFDENLQLPQSLKLYNFYVMDMWKHSFLFFQNVRHRIVLEWVWTFIPTLILLLLVIPSLYLLYTYDKPYVTAPYITFKAIGNQWYWDYEYWDYEDADKTGGLLSFSSNMLHDDELELGQLRLLEVDNRLVLPAGVCIRLITTSVDVLHSWAVPAFGVKIDSVPGRLNQFWLVLNKPGVYYGQCSELCGVNHGFMPIAVEVVYLEQYLEFLSMLSEE